MAPCPEAHLQIFIQFNMLSSADDKVKILVIGPAHTGKTCIANALSNTRDTPTAEYKETAPLRILETELDGLKLKGRRTGRGAKVLVEIWDVGGSPKFQGCWAAIHRNADGIIYVVNPEINGQEKELELWYKSFAQPSNMPDGHCLLFSHHSSPPERAVGHKAIPTVPRCLEQVRALETSLDFQSDNFKEAFEKLVETIMVDRQEAEENKIMRDDGPIKFGGTH